MNNKIWEFVSGTGPLIATAIHDGHEVRDSLKNILLISEDGRLREEDPYTREWTSMADTRIIGTRSRFEVDLNRPREKAVYINPEDAWNLHVWKSKPSHNEIYDSLMEYDAFYSEMHSILSKKEAEYGHFMVFDIHSYNHMRNGPNGLPADPELNPEVNIGSGNTERDYWAPVIDKFIRKLSDFDYNGKHLDVRENVKFKGGYFSK